MDDRGAVDFKAAAKRHDELGERQLEILALIAEGLSNGEIAAALGLSLDETKWNVGALISKLGLSNRDEAAAYYRWRQRSGRKVARNAGMVAAGAVAVGVVVLVALALWPGGESGTPGAFYVEVVTEFDNTWALTVGTNIDEDDELDLDGEELIFSTVGRYWFEPPNKWRVESDTPNGTLAFVAVFDGEDLTMYYPQQNTFIRPGMGPLPGWESFLWLPTGVPIGRVPGENGEEYLSLSFYSEGDTILRRADKLDGESVVLFEQAFERQCQPPTLPEEGSSSTSCTDIIRFWIDEERMLIVRGELWPDDEHRISLAKVTVFDDNVTHDPALFEFVPPDGAVDLMESAEDENPFD